MRKLGRWACAALVGVGTVLAASPAAAQDSGEQPERAEYAPTMLVLDASGSMKEADPSGGTKIDAAKRAVHTVVDAAPEGSKIGLTAYGTNTGSSNAEKEAGCRDVTVLRAPEAVDRAALKPAVDGLTPRGYTPIGTALRTAADALPNEGPRAIVLVSDGEDTCAPPDPCEVARELSGQGLDLVVHAVGFGVDDKAREQLTCIAQATGGSYTEAPDAKSLEDTLPRVTATALRNYDAVGTPVTGTADQRSAPELTPGQYLDSLRQGEKRFYAVDIPQGMTAYLAATMSFQRGHRGGSDLNRLELDLYGPNGEVCYGKQDRDLATRSTDGEAGVVSMTFDGATKPVENKRCTGGGRYTFQVSWALASTNQPVRLPVELLVGLEPEVTGDKGPAPAKESEVAGYTEPGGGNRSVTGGGSFTTAGTLDGAGHFIDTLRPGEFVFYRVRLDWDQALAYRVSYEAIPDRDNRFTTNVKTNLYTPFRQEIDTDTAAYTGSGTTLPGANDAVATAPIRYRNRDATPRSLRPQSIAGWYYIAVKLGLPSSSTNPGNPVPVRLDVSVTGAPQEGPAYKFASGAEQEAGVFGEGKARGSSSSTAPDSARQEAQGETADTVPVAWLIGGGAGAVVLAAGVVLASLLRRRRTFP